MTTKAERQAHNASGLRASDFPCPPIPLMHPNAEWCEAYAKWHDAFHRAARRGPGGWKPIDTAPKGELVLVRNEAGRCDVCYQTNNGEPFLETWRYQDGTQAGWPTLWMPLPLPPQ